MNTIEKERHMEVERVREAMADAVPYREYREEMQRQAAAGETSGPVQSDALIGYTLLNDRRMRRWEKTFSLPGALEARLGEFREKQEWLVLTESWCGDAAPILPVLQAFASATPGIRLRIAERDRHPELMERFRTDGALAIPKVLVVDPQSKAVLRSWGPRPSEPMEMAREYKRQHGALSPEFRETLQRWYNKDKGEALAREFLELLALE